MFLKEIGPSIEAAAVGTMTPELMYDLDFFGWADPEWGLISLAVFATMEGQDGVLMETTGMAHTIADAFGLSVEARQYLLGKMGRAKDAADVSDLNTQGFPKVRYGKPCHSRIWGLPGDVEAFKNKKFTGAVKLARAFNSGPDSATAKRMAEQIAAEEATRCKAS